MWILQSWVVWIFVVAMGVVWGLPHLPHYHRDLPYIYDLGGTIFVMWYMGLGFLSLGLYALVAGCVHLGNSRRIRVRAFLLGGGSLLIAGTLWWLHKLFINLSIRLG